MLPSAERFTPGPTHRFSMTGARQFLPVAIGRNRPHCGRSSPGQKHGSLLGVIYLDDLSVFLGNYRE